MWSIRFTHTALNELKRLDKPLQQRILNYLETRLACCINPKDQGKALTGKMKKFWRYRVGDYRIICNINDKVVTILVLRIAHRKEVYVKDLA